MDDPPVVVIGIRGGTLADLILKGVAQVVVIYWDELAEGSLGKLCHTYKQIWSLPESIREGPLCALIREVRRRFPFTATFQAQHLVGDMFQNYGPKVVFDATEPILRMGPDAIDNLSDPFYPVEQLAAGLPERENHTGQFEVVVDGQALEFIHSEENEAGNAKKHTT